MKITLDKNGIIRYIDNMKLIKEIEITKETDLSRIPVDCLGFTVIISEGKIKIYKEENVS